MLYCTTKDVCVFDVTSRECYTAKRSKQLRLDIGFFVFTSIISSSWIHNFKLLNNVTLFLKKINKILLEKMYRNYTSNDFGDEPLTSIQQVSTEMKVIKDMPSTTIKEINDVYIKFKDLDKRIQLSTFKKPAHFETEIMPELLHLIKNAANSTYSSGAIAAHGQFNNRLSKVISAVDVWFNTDKVDPMSVKSILNEIDRILNLPYKEPSDALKVFVSFKKFSEQLSKTKLVLNDSNAKEILADILNEITKSYESVVKANPIMAKFHYNYFVSKMEQFSNMLVQSAQ